MTPDTLNLRLQRGADTAVPILLMDSSYRYAEIESINATAPLSITAPGHGLPGPEWPVWIEGTTSSQLNRDKTRQPFVLAQVVDEDLIEFNDRNGQRLSASGGHIVYHPPLDTAGWEFEANFFAKDTQLLALTLGAGIQRTDGGLTLTLTEQQAAELSIATHWELIVQHSAGRQRYLCGSVSIQECEAHGNRC